jgi:hypothetical protein
MDSNGKGSPKIGDYCYIGADANAIRLKPDATQYDATHEATYSVTSLAIL